MRENAVKKRAMILLSQQKRCVVFVNVVGTAWFGKFLQMKDGVVTLLGGRRYPVGWHEGSPDVMGWKSVVVTPRMVGKRIAVLLGIEMKQPGEKPEPEQRHFLDRLTSDGAIAGWADSADGAAKIVDDYLEELEK